MKALVEAKANVDKKNKKGLTPLIRAVLYAVKKMENLMSEKRTRYKFKEIALSVLTFLFRYRRILLPPPHPP